MVAYEAIWEKDSGDEVETVEAGGNDVQNPLQAEEDVIICSSNISGGYRVLLIMNPTYRWG